MSIMTTRSGKIVRLMEVEASDIDIQDIAHSLGNLCRFNGHCSRFYSVAEHSLHVSEYFFATGRSIEIQLQALLHDAAEAYIGDIVHPLKTLLPEVKVLEDRIHSAICEKFNIPSDLPETISVIDKRLASTEAIELMDFDSKVMREYWADWIDRHPPIPNIKIMGYSARDARDLFLMRFERLQKSRSARI